MLKDVWKNLTRRSQEPVDEQPSAVSLWLNDTLSCPGYISLADCPEVKSGIEKIAEIISSMTIYLMENTDTGDKRVENSLSRKIDINPNSYLTRQLFISWIVQEMLVNGNAFVLPITRQGLIDELVPIPMQNRTIHSGAYRYDVIINNKYYGDDEVLNFRYNPDLKKPWLGRSQSVILQDLVENLAQARKTTKDFMRTRTLPSLIVKVDAMTDGMDTEAGRAIIEKRFLQRSETGQPWIIPGNIMDIQQVKPLTLQDIAIDKNIELSTKAVASILGVPAFLLGSGEFNREEYNNFIKSKILVICKSIEQELTKKLLLSEKMYFKFNNRSLLNYDLKELGDLYLNLYKAGIVTGNEVRNVLDMSPRVELEELIVLENFIPIEKIGDQKKLGEDNEADAV